MKYAVTADAEAEIVMEGSHAHAKERPRTVVEVRQRIRGDDRIGSGLLRDSDVHGRLFGRRRRA